MGKRVELCCPGAQACCSQAGEVQWDILIFQNKFNNNNKILFSVIHITFYSITMMIRMYNVYKCIPSSTIEIIYLVRALSLSLPLCCCSSAIKHAHITSYEGSEKYTSDLCIFRCCARLGKSEPGSHIFYLRKANISPLEQ